MTATGGRGLRGAEGIRSYGGSATATAGGGSGGARRRVTPLRGQPRARAARRRLRDLVFLDRRGWVRPFLGAPRRHTDHGAREPLCACRRDERVLVRRGDHGVKARRARAVALREAMRQDWDAEAVEAALRGSTEPTLWLAARRQHTQSTAARGNAAETTASAARCAGWSGAAARAVNECRWRAGGAAVSFRRRAARSGTRKRGW